MSATHCVFFCGAGVGPRCYECALGKGRVSPPSPSLPPLPSPVCTTAARTCSPFLPPFRSGCVQPFKDHAVCVLSHDIHRSTITGLILDRLLASRLNLSSSSSSQSRTSRVVGHRDLRRISDADRLKPQLHCPPPLARLIPPSSRVLRR